MPGQFVGGVLWVRLMEKWHYSEGRMSNGWTFDVRLICFGATGERHYWGMISKHQTSYLSILGLSFF